MLLPIRIPSVLVAVVVSLLAWDDPVVKHLPWFQLKDPAVTRELTVRDLLTHRGGLGNADYLWYGQSNSTEEILKRVRLIEPAYSVRSSFIYQNIMYAGRKPWAETRRRRSDPGRRRPAASLWARFRRSTRALALRHISREMDGRVARSGAGDIWTERRGQTDGRRPDGRSFRPPAVARKRLYRSRRYVR